MAVAMQNDQQQHEIYMAGLDAMTRALDAEASHARDRAAAGEDHTRARSDAAVDHARGRLDADDEATRGELTAAQEFRRSRATQAEAAARSSKDADAQRAHELRLAKTPKPGGPKK
jgi:hypothetical protein